jgi:hypothetical protein
LKWEYDRRNEILSVELGMKKPSTKCIVLDSDDRKKNGHNSAQTISLIKLEILSKVFIVTWAGPPDTVWHCIFRLSLLFFRKYRVKKMAS